MPVGKKCPGSSTLTADGNACTLKLDIPLYCGLNDSSVPGWPRCYGKGGESLEIPAQPAVAGSSVTSDAATKKLKPSCTDIMNVQYGNLIDSINEIHSFEGSLFDKLQTVENGGKADMSASDLRSRIEDLSRLRNQLYVDLTNMLTSTQCSLADSRQNLADQVAMVEIVKKEFDVAEQTIKELEIVKDNRQRMVEISTYEKERFASHKNIFRTIAFCGLGILLSIFVINYGFPSIGKAGIVTSIAVALVLTVRQIYDIWWKDNMDWKRYNFGGLPGGKGSGETVIQHNRRALGRLWTDTKSGASYLSTRADEGISRAEDTLSTVAGAAGSVADQAVADATAKKVQDGNKKTTESFASAASY